jgi:hypothetical protein
MCLTSSPEPGCDVTPVKLNGPQSRITFRSHLYVPMRRDVAKDTGQKSTIDSCPSTSEELQERGSTLQPLQLPSKYGASLSSFVCENEKTQVGIVHYAPVSLRAPGHLPVTFSSLTLTRCLLLLPL